MGSRNWFKYVLAITLVLGTGFESLATPSDREKVEQAQIYFPVDLSDTAVIWDTCGSWNGAYYHVFNTIVLCNENLTEGVGVARFIFLHELGHRFTFYYGTDFTRWGENYEAGADEFAAIFSIVQGNPEDLLAMARVFREWGNLYVHDEEDEHPTMESRAKMLEDIYYSYISGVGLAYRNALKFWHSELLRTLD